jgi:hypothetical protein
MPFDPATTALKMRPSTPFLDGSAKRFRLPWARMQRATAVVLELLQRHAAAGDLLALRTFVPEFGLLLAPSLPSPARPLGRLGRIWRSWFGAITTEAHLRRGGLGEFMLPLAATVFEHLRQRLGTEVAERMLHSVPGLPARTRWPLHGAEGPAAGGPGQRRIA